MCYHKHNLLTTQSRTHIDSGELCNTAHNYAIKMRMRKPKTHEYIFQTGDTNWENTVRPICQLSRYENLDSARLKLSITCVLLFRRMADPDEEFIAVRNTLFLLALLCSVLVRVY